MIQTATKKPSGHYVKLQNDLLKDLRRKRTGTRWDIEREKVRLSRIERILAKLSSLVENGVRLPKRELMRAWWALGLGDKADKDPDTVRVLYGYMLELLGWTGDDCPAYLCDDKHAANTQPQRRPSSDPLAEAVNIVRAASAGGLDWTKEATSDRERAIRRKVLTQLYDSWSGLTHDMYLLGMKLPSDYPSDVKQFADELHEAEKSDERAELLKDLQYETDRAARELDGLPIEDNEAESQ